MPPSLPDMMTPDAAALAMAAKGASPLEKAAQGTLVEFLLRAGDNALILGHRLSEWCGHGPILEEDIALANVALDLIGETQLWLSLAGEVEGAGRSADDLAFLRDASAFRNVLLVERPNGDYGHTLMRQFLFDAWRLPFLDSLAQSCEPRIVEIAAKTRREAAYHLERSADLVIRLGDGTEESHRRMQRALEALWPYAGELAHADAIDQAIAQAGIAPSPETLRPAWEETLRAVFSEATLTMPETNFHHKGGKSGRHTEHLGHLLATMQFLQRAYPGAQW